MSYSARKPSEHQLTDASDSSANDAELQRIPPKPWRGRTAQDVGLERCGGVSLRDDASAEWSYHVATAGRWAALVVLDVRRTTGAASRGVRAMLQSAGLARAIERYLVASEPAPSAATLRAATQAGDQAARLVSRALELARAEAAERRAAQPAGPADARALLTVGYEVGEAGAMGGEVGYRGGGGAQAPGANGAGDTPTHNAVLETDRAADLSPAEAAAEASEAVGELSVLVGHGLLEEEG